jgi:hypothetical protein
VQFKSNLGQGKHLEIAIKINAIKTSKIKINAFIHAALVVKASHDVPGSPLLDNDSQPPTG